MVDPLSRIAAAELEELRARVGSLDLVHHGQLSKDCGLLTGRVDRSYFLFRAFLVSAQSPKHNAARPPEERAGLSVRKCIPLRGLRLRTSARDDLRFEILEESGKISCLWAADAAARELWVETLSTCISSVEFGPPPSRLAQPLPLADDEAVREEVAQCCAWQKHYGVVVQSGAHAVVSSSREPSELRKRLSKLAPREQLATEPALGGTALHLAVAAGKGALIEAIAQQLPALLEQPDKNGVRPLLAAAILCTRAATAGATAHGTGTASSASDTLAALLRAGAAADAGCAYPTADTPLLVCLRGGCHAEALALLQHGASAHALCISSGTPALHLAIANGVADVVRAVLDAGAGGNQHGPDGSALHVAAATHPASPEVIGVLLSYGAQPNSPWKGDPPLRRLPSLAADSLDAEQLSSLCDAVEALVRGGARLDVPDAHSHTFEQWQPHATVRLIARQAAAARVAIHRQPQLMLCQHNALYRRLAAQLALPTPTIDGSAPCAACGGTRGGRSCALLKIPTCDSCSSKFALVNAKKQAPSRVCDAAYNMLIHLQALATQQPKDAIFNSVPKSAAADTSSTHSASTSTTCVICISSESIMCLVPCGHMCLCSSCSALLMQRSRQCPVCRRSCQQAVRVYKS